MKKIIDLNSFKKILVNKEEKTSFVNEKQTETKHSLISPDNDIVNVIDTPFIVLKRNNKIHFINTAAKTNFNLSSEDNIFHTFRTPEFHENISKIKDKKITRRFVMLSLKNSKPGTPLLLHDEPIYLEDEIIGRTTSGNFSFNYNKNLSFGYINTDLSNEDLLTKNLFIEVEKKKYPALLENKPLKHKIFA